MTFMDIAMPRMEKILDLIYTRYKNPAVHAALTKLVWEGVDFTEQLTLLEKEHKKAGYNRRPLMEIENFRNMLIIHGLECGKAYTLYAVQHANKLSDKEQKELRSKDDITKFIDLKGFESILDEVLLAPPVLKELGKVNAELKSHGCKSDIQDMQHWEQFMRVHGVAFSSAYFDLLMKTNMIELFKRRVRG